MSEPHWLDEAEQAIWLAYVKSAVRLLALLDHDLKRRHGISGADYEVLHHLSQSPDGQLRLGELAALVADSTSRMSHRIDRLVARGLVEKGAIAGDRRGRGVCLTTAGHSLLVQAAPEHVAAVRRLFIDAFARDELRALADPLAKLTAHLAARVSVAPDEAGAM